MTPPPTLPFPLFPATKVFRCHGLPSLFVARSILFRSIQPSFFLSGGFHQRIIPLKFSNRTPKTQDFKMQARFNSQSSVNPKPPLRAA